MGVMSCDRRGCSNVMCDRYSDEHGYICPACYEELVGSNTIDIAAFMKTPQPDVPPIPRIWYARVFPLGDN